MAIKGTVLADRNIMSLIEHGCITGQMQDARACSMDLRISSNIWQTYGIPSLAGGFNFSRFSKSYLFNPNPEVLTPGSVYLAELDTYLNLPSTVHGVISPKSSAGRIDFQCIVIAEGGEEFNIIPAGYEGRLYIVLIPQSFPVKEIVDQDFVQLRLFNGPRRFLSNFELEMVNMKCGLVDGRKAHIVDDGILLHLDLKSYDPPFLVSVVSGKPVSSLARDMDPEDNFRYKKVDANGTLFLDPGEFLLAPTVEKVRVPEYLCAEMVAYREQQGEFKPHSAGFFDAGFGFGRNGNAKSATGVCEIRNISTARLMLSHGQPIAMLKYEYMYEVPEFVYGETRPGSKPSNYQSQNGVRLAKFFRPWPVPVQRPTLVD